MDRDFINTICAELPGAEVSDPWAAVGRDSEKDGQGHDAWKIGGKMFASIGAVTPGVSLKTNSVETSQMLIDVGVGKKAPYFHRSWVLLPFETDEEELRHRLTGSYEIIRNKLTKKAQAALPQYPA
jgi:predicted DNA-binding protein (MmcQ/YjbR family)